MSTRLEGLAVVIFGYWQRMIVLAMKLDDCARCGLVREHMICRKTKWGHVFWLPVLLLGVEHGMGCAICGTWRRIAWRDVRTALRTGVMPVQRARPDRGTVPYSSAVATSSAPEPPTEMDRIQINRHRGFWEIYLKLWPALVVILLIVILVAPHV